MASEELNTRYPKNKGKKIGSYELFECQSVTLKQFAEHGILPNRDYGDNAAQKPDCLIISRVPNVRAVLVGEFKKPGGITDSNWKKIALDLLDTKCRPTDAPIGIVSDMQRTHWINGRAVDVLEITREDGVSLPQKIDLNDEAFLTELQYVITYFDPVINQVRAKIRTNPDHLAREVWQTVWRLRADKPEDCLATFVEVFIFKFLDDLSLLKQDDAGHPISLEWVMKLDREKSYKYYWETIRPYMKKLFPAGADGYSIIDGIVLQKTNRDHNIIFHEIMKKFIKFGSLKNTDPDFKRRLYESFLKQSKTTSTFGQFFTPRAIVSAIHDMAEVEKITHGQTICDPAAGVGGFILEQMARDLASQWNLKARSMKCIHHYLSFEKIPKTSILAKANALVHCGDFLADQPSRIRSFSKWLNDTFVCYDKTALGSLELLSKSKYDLIMTNPPFVVSGSRDYGKIIQSDNKRRRYFSEKHSGVEGLFLQFVVKALKPNGDAWILLPESFFLRTPDRELRNWLLKNCELRFVALLPERVFYNTPKRVCILNFRKRTRVESDGTVMRTLEKEKTLVFALSEIGETRDAKRFRCSSDLPDMISTYKLHKAGVSVEDRIERAVVIKPSRFYNKRSLNLRQFWDKSTAIKLGLLGSVESAEEAKNRVQNQLNEIEAFLMEYKESFVNFQIPKKPKSWRKLSLGERDYFNLRIGKRVYKKDIYNIRTEIPVYSANIRKPFGFVASANAGNLEYGGCLWSIDSDWDCRGVPPGEVYSITDHCGQVEVVVPNIDPHYLARQIKQVGTDLGFSREFRPSLRIMADIAIELPVTSRGEFDIDAMEEDTLFYEELEKLRVSLGSVVEDEGEKEQED